LAFLSLFKAAEATLISDDEEDTELPEKYPEPSPDTAATEPFSFDLKTLHVIPQDDDDAPLLVKDQNS